MNSRSVDTAYITDDNDLQKMYEAARDDATALAMHTIWRNLTESGIILISQMQLNPVE